MLVLEQGLDPAEFGNCFEADGRRSARLCVRMAASVLIPGFARLKKVWRRRLDLYATS